MGPTCIICILVRQTHKGEDTKRRRQCGHGSENGSDVATSRGMPGAPGNWKRQGRDYPYSLCKDCDPVDTCVWLLASRIVTEQISIVLSHPVCGYLLQQP